MKKLSEMFLCLALVIFAVSFFTWPAKEATAATISGTVYKSDGVTPLTGISFSVKAYTGSPCGSMTLVGDAIVNLTNGTYTIPFSLSFGNALPAGTYYLKTFSSENYSEWWASPLSVRDCAGAQPIVVAEGQAVIGKDFQLDPVGTFATISGTMYQSDGETPLTGKIFSVYAYTGSSCGSMMLVGSGSVDSTNGTYTIYALPADTYYLRADNIAPFFFVLNHLIEWWASPLSVRDCADAQPIVVAEGQAVTGKNFQLDPGATISGTVYQSDGVTPVIGGDIFSNCKVSAYTGFTACDSNFISSGSFNSAGQYTISGLPSGTYYLKTSTPQNYYSEWWASPLSVWDCAGAQPIVVTEGQAVTSINFQLDPLATISGTVYKSDGVTPLTGNSVSVHAYTGSLCFISMSVGNAIVDSTNGTYTISGLPAGTYYLQTDNSSDNYYIEWWASPLSVRDCAGAQPIVVTEGQAVTSINFQLDPLATISGTVYQSDGVTPLIGKSVTMTAYTGSPCGSMTGVGNAIVDSTNGTYTISGLPAGTYYLQSSSANFISEWWASPLSVRDCVGAQPIVVTEGQSVIGKDFQLDPGATISGTVSQSNGLLPIIGTVSVYTGSPCGSMTLVGSAVVNPMIGTYTISGLPAGTYYLQTSSSPNYISEWWASPLSVWDCAGAQPIVVAEGQAVTGKNFQLDLGATISGTIYQNNGVTPLTGKNVTVTAYTGSPCGSMTGVGSAVVNPMIGTYTISGLPAGTYYLRTYSSSEYINEWWASPLSVRDCAGAQPIVVAEGQAVTGKNFQLDLAGDVNINNVVDLTDAILALQVVVGGNSAIISITADVNGDNRIGMADVIYILQKVARLK